MLRERTSSGAGEEPWSQHKLAAQRLSARHCLGVHAETFTERGEGALWDLLKLLQNLLGTGQEIFGLGHPGDPPHAGMGLSASSLRGGSAVVVSWCVPTSRESSGMTFPRQGTSIAQILFGLGGSDGISNTSSPGCLALV